MRKAIALTFVLFVFAALGAAQGQTSGNVFFGYSYYSSDLTFNRGSLNGWEGSLEGKVLPFLGIVADFSGHYGSLDFPVSTLCPVNTICGGTFSASAHMENVMFGPRVSVPAGRLRPFGEALFGIGHVSTGIFGSDTSFASAFGGGLDYRIVRPIALRFQGDYVRTRLFSLHQNNMRISTGIVLRF